MREVVYTIIAGNPYIKESDKPHNSQSIFKLNDDKMRIEKIYIPPTPDELEATRQELLNLMNKK